MQLIKPTPAYKEKALAYRKAHFDIGETEIQGDNNLDVSKTYEEWLDYLDFVEAGKHEIYLPSSTYFAVIDDEIVGIVDIRHRLNDALLKCGGHIGYSTHPQHRRKGYATQILRLALEKCKAMGIEKVLVTCNKENIGSQKTILNNGGVLENEYTDEKGQVTLRHWLDATNGCGDS